jgi:hypothetical protein
VRVADGRVRMPLRATARRVISQLVMSWCVIARYVMAWHVGDGLAPRARCAAYVLTLLTLVLLAPSAAHAQRLRLTLADTTGRAPVGGAIVTVLRDDRSTHLEAIVPASGVRTLSINAPGVYRLRIRRVGYRPFESDTLALVAGEDRAVALRLPEQRIPLVAVRTRSRTQCTGGGPFDDAAGELLESARTTLLSATLAWREQIEPIESFLVERERSLSGVVRDSSWRRLDLRVGQPFESADARTLHTQGYVTVDLSSPTRDYVYALPSPQAMISPAFTETHCFAIVEHPGDTALVGLRFEPVQAQRKADVRGTMWLERTERALTLIEFAYQHVTYPAATTGATGRVRIRALPSGVRFIDEWHIRMPLFGAVWSGPTMGNRVRQVGWKEDGGAARVRLTGRGADTIPLARVPGRAFPISTWGYH